MIRLPTRSTLSSSSAASDVYKRQVRGSTTAIMPREFNECPSNSSGYFREASLHFSHTERHVNTWEGSDASPKCLAILYQTCAEYNVDLGRLFAHFANGRGIMLGHQFHDFATSAQLFSGPADADPFFQMAMGSEYRPTLRINAGRFDTGLVRVFEKMSAQQHIKQAHACNNLVRDHLVPLVAVLFAQPLEPHAHHVAYGYGGPRSMWPRYGEEVTERYSPACTPLSRSRMMR
eukprot:TRINITY_DN49813_c0_g1_i1.p1 TRINITY_DN49813_c0_g1~~TRINITY_DN49813_c0_g1_i1.p1  ORF type:complete len:233 (+),score=33.97 TRINITY_DN49813_c0_g1_i1:46-744(+)